MNTRHLTPGSIKSRAATTFNWLMNIIATIGLILAILAVIGVAVTTALWVYNVHDLDDEISQLSKEIDIINASLPDGNGTVVFDDEWIMANGPEPSRKFMLNASLVSMGIKRNYAVPDTDGIFLLEETFVPVFLENEFAVVGEFDETTRMEFDLSLIPGATTHTYSWPNKDGTVAMVSDIVAILVNGSDFLDSSFHIVNDPDMTKVAMFYAGNITTGTTRQYTFPNINGTLALTTGVQTLSDKTIDNTNSITVIDSNFAIEESAGSNAVLFDADALTTDRIVLFPDLAGTFVYTDGAQTISDKILDNTNSITVVDSNLAIEDTAGGNSELFDADALTTDRTTSFQDKDCTMACLDDITVTSSLITFTPASGVAANIGLLGCCSTRVVQMGTDPPVYSMTLAVQWTNAAPALGFLVTLGSFPSTNGPPGTTWATAQYGPTFDNIPTSVAAIINPNGDVQIQNSGTTGLAMNDFIVFSSVTWRET